MPRLLLVDDNPSIHRIAESLLAPTDVELVCVDSAAEALDRIGRGERFDVALVDTAMPGMDGWTLLTRLRSMEETAGIPIALMAGVLDPVDPAKLAKAPIQGFLKKPIELRELGDRVKALLATPVVASPSPFSTVPATPARDLVKRAEEALPEYRPEPVAAAAGFADEAVAGFTEADLDLPELEDDLLVLTASDLWPEEPAAVLPEPAAFPSAFADVHLDLEELDLDSLQDLTGEPLSEVPPAADAHPESAPAFEDLPDLSGDEDHLVTLSGLEELETLPADFDLPVSSPAAPALAEPDGFLAHLPAAASLIGIAGVVGAAEFAVHEPAHEAAVEPAMEPAHEATQEVHEPIAMAHEEPIALPEPTPAPAAGGQDPAVPGQLIPAPEAPAPVGSEQTQALVQALLADPVLLDALVKALVARMGDQVLREIAWEVMPDLAGRLQR